ncbi:MAG: hypothetical protein ACM31C_26755 [Acidobacteriota bacterium]
MRVEIAMRALAVVLACGTAAAAPAQLATGAVCAAGRPTVKEILPASAVAGSVKILPSATGGLDVFWTGQGRVGDPHFLGMYAAFSASGQRLTRPVKLLDDPIRSVAAGGAGTFAIVHSVSTTSGWQAYVALARPARGQIVWDVPLPSPERGHGTTHVAWDGRTRSWLVVGEELVQLPDRAPGYVYNRLFVTRLDRDGKQLEAPRYIQEPGMSASLGDWGTPLVAAGGKIAFVWAAHRDRVRTLYVTELDGDRVTHTAVAATEAGGYMRVAIAAIAGGYAVAGGESGADPMSSRAFVTTLRDGVVAPLTYLASARTHTSDPVVASDGARVGVAWNEDELGEPDGNRRSLVHAAVIDGQGAVHAAYDTKTPLGRHDWTSSLAWDGCRFALVHLVGINPSAVDLVRF